MNKQYVDQRDGGYWFQTAHAAGLAGLGDTLVLSMAAEQGRLLVTHDRKTMPTHFGRFIEAEESSGVLIVSQRLPVSQVAADLLLIWGQPASPKSG